MIKCQPYQQPKSRFKPGEWVSFIDEALPLAWKVASSTHTHTKLEGFKWGVANWKLKRVKKPTRKPSY